MTIWASSGTSESPAKPHYLWIRLGPAVLYQDNMSTIFLANRGRSTSERTRHIKVRHFFVAHYVEAKEIRIEYMPTTHMIADILTKALHGTLFKKFSAAITGNDNNTSGGKKI